MMFDHLLAWHFIGPDRRLAQRALTGGVAAPHSGVLVTPGLKLAVAGRPVPEAWGLHASVSPADALFWARGLVVCRVALGGLVVTGDRKVAAQERTVLWLADATHAVWEWGVWCAREWVARARRRGQVVWPESLAAVQARALWLTDAARGADAIKAAYTGARRVAATHKGDRLAALCSSLVSPSATAHQNVARRAPGWDRTEAGAGETRDLERRLLALAPAVE